MLIKGVHKCHKIILCRCLTMCSWRLITRVWNISQHLSVVLKAQSLVTILLYGSLCLLVLSLSLCSWTQGLEVALRMYIGFFLHRLICSKLLGLMEVGSVIKREMPVGVASYWLWADGGHLAVIAVGALVALEESNRKAMTVEDPNTAHVLLLSVENAYLRQLLSWIAISSTKLSVLVVSPAVQVAIGIKSMTEVASDRDVVQL